MRAVYGLAVRDEMTPELTYDERIRMREHLDALDKKEATVGEFDLNKPPLKPYVHREYPMVLYSHATKQTQVAHNYEQRQTMLAQGWSIDPEPPKVAPEPETVGADGLTAAERAEIEALDAQLVKKRRS